MSLLWLRIAVLLYGVAALAVLPAALFERPRWRHLVVPATGVGVLLHGVSLAEVLNAAHHTLPMESHETQSTLALLLAVAFLVVWGRYRTMSPGVFLLPVAVLLLIAPAFPPGIRAGSAQLPAAHAGWIFLHIALLMAAYAALVVSLLASALYLLQERRLKRKQPALRGLPPLAVADELGLKALLWGLPCMTAGLLIGSALAEQTVGLSYFRDPKVLLSFALWMAYMGMIFIRRHSGLRGRRAVYLSGFVFLAVLAVWAANLFSSVHRFQAP